MPSKVAFNAAMLADHTEAASDSESDRGADEDVARTSRAMETSIFGHESVKALSEVAGPVDAFGWAVDNDEEENENGNEDDADADTDEGKEEAEEENEESEDEDKEMEKAAAEEEEEEAAEEEVESENVNPCWARKACASLEHLYMTASKFIPGSRLSSWTS
jgi:hypothetical protein